MKTSDITDELEFELPCESCGGTGRNDYGCECVSCDGVGTILTDAGRKVVAMLGKRLRSLLKDSL